MLIYITEIVIYVGCQGKNDKIEENYPISMSDGEVYILCCMKIEKDLYTIKY